MVEQATADMIPVTLTVMSMASSTSGVPYVNSLLLMLLAYIYRTWGLSEDQPFNEAGQKTGQRIDRKQNPNYVFPSPDKC